jgi:hypothetical protein
MGWMLIGLVEDHLTATEVEYSTCPNFLWSAKYTSEYRVGIQCRKLVSSQTWQTHTS